MGWGAASAPRRAAPRRASRTLRRASLSRKRSSETLPDAPARHPARPPARPPARARAASVALAARAVAVHFGVVPGADGSAECRLGQTIACAAVYGPLDGGRSADTGGEGSAYGAASGGAELRVEYAEARFAAAGMRARRLGRARQADSAAPLKAALASAVLLEQLPRSRVEVRVHVLSADGGAVGTYVSPLGGKKEREGVRKGPLCSPGGRRPTSRAPPAHPRRWQAGVRM